KFVAHLRHKCGLDALAFLGARSQGRQPFIEQVELAVGVYLLLKHCIQIEVAVARFVQPLLRKLIVLPCPGDQSGDGSRDACTNKPERDNSRYHHFSVDGVYKAIALPHGDIEGKNDDNNDATLSG